MTGAASGVLAFLSNKQQALGDALHGAVSRLQLSVVVPALDEESRVARAIESCEASSSASGIGIAEVVVVDGGSTDSTVQHARKAGAKVFQSPRGRAVQMNTGAEHTTGDAIMFLHADTTLPPGYRQHMRAALDQHARRHGADAWQWGCFETIQTDDYRWRSRLLRAGVWLRTHLTHMPYGDQALFVRSRMFRDLHGFKAVPLMEDVDLVRRLRRMGPPVIVRRPVTTSARRWNKHGFVKTTLINQAILLAYNLGVDPHVLATWYYGQRAK